MSWIWAVNAATCGHQNFYGAFVLNHRVVLHAIEKNHPTHWLISTQAAYGGLVLELLR